MLYYMESSACDIITVSFYPPLEEPLIQSITSCAILCLLIQSASTSILVLLIDPASKWPTNSNNTCRNLPIMSKKGLQWPHTHFCSMTPTGRANKVTVPSLSFPSAPDHNAIVESPVGDKNTQLLSSSF